MTGDRLSPCLLSRSVSSATRVRVTTGSFKRSESLVFDALSPRTTTASDLCADIRSSASALWKLPTRVMTSTWGRDSRIWSGVSGGRSLVATTLMSLFLSFTQKLSSSSIMCGTHSLKPSRMICPLSRTSPRPLLRTSRLSISLPMMMAMSTPLNSTIPMKDRTRIVILTAVSWSLTSNTLSELIMVMMENQRLSPCANFTPRPFRMAVKSQTKPSETRIIVMTWRRIDTSRSRLKR